MAEELQQYYKWLSEKPDRYLELARIYVPIYDRMVEFIVEEVKREVGRVILSSTTEDITILDLGCGVGNIAYEISTSLRECYIHGIDIEENMIRLTQNMLEEHIKRGKATIEKLNILDLNSYDKYNIVYSNLTLHNLPYTDKERALTKIYKALKEEGLFIWGDTIKFEDDKMNRMMWNNKIKYSIEHGALRNPWFFIKSFYKEMFEDYALTEKETQLLLHKHGFIFEKKQIYSKYGFAVFVARRSKSNF